MIKRFRLWLLRRKMSSAADRVVSAAERCDIGQTLYLLKRMASLADQIKEAEAQ